MEPILTTASTAPMTLAVYNALKTLDESPLLQLTVGEQEKRQLMQLGYVTENELGLFRLSPEGKEALENFRSHHEVE
ncbi:hypothetical protein [Amantichitinum ursilacus]|uniref:Uncharacterized protein n=1 Tax=Amantichitinum ursilacus TaxID=857265 RepID=A0A0N0GM18_9NEIS|nr:hypothetical protein [Amantichitinum ursilacus]KPC50497.1 hypothetical protein WG78_16870 [Amantichitinum ursilacus]